MIIATAGHVDHGKTSLVKTLTGTDTDRHPEEKKRGLTIDIGFAYMRARSGQNIALIDVPGHEKFVRNMIAGVGLVDIALLIVAADDGPMPQTIEHIAILQLMGVKLVVPVISKTDLVEKERQAQVVEELSALLQAAKLPTVDYFQMSVLDKEAVMALKEKLMDLVESLPERKVRGHFRMPVDRCFTLDGSGTVVTGSVSSGKLEQNQTLTLIGEGSSERGSARARGIHTQNTESVEAVAGQRCAVNLSGSLTRNELRRGCWMVTNPSAVTTTILDVTLEVAFSSEVFRSEAYKPNPGDQKVRHWTPAHLHVGTADIPCRIALLDCSVLRQGEKALARLICERPLTAAHGDRFVLRDQSAWSTIAGGTVLDVLPPRRGRSKPARLQQLAALNASSSEQALNNLLAINPYGINLDQFALRFNLLDSEKDSLCRNNDLLILSTVRGDWCYSKSQSAEIENKVLTTLLDQHAENPDQLGVGVEVVHRAIGRQLSNEMLEHHLKALVKKKQVVRVASIFRHAEHQVAMSQSDEEAWNKVERGLIDAQLTPLRVTELADVLERDAEETRRFMNHCVAHGKVFKVTDNRYFLPDTLYELAAIAGNLSEVDKLTVAEFRNESGIGRNLVVELLEYFDRCRFTQRIGDKRVVLKPASQAF